MDMKHREHLFVKNLASLKNQLINQKLPGQPAAKPAIDQETGEDIMVAESVFLTSVLHHDSGMVAGSVSQSTVELAARRVGVEQTHRVSTESEIKNYLDFQKAQKALHDENDYKAAKKRANAHNPEQAAPAFVVRQD